MVEHSAVNRVVVGSSPTGGAWLHGQAVKTSPFHGGNTSSILVGVIFLLSYDIKKCEQYKLIWRDSQAVRHRSATP